MSWSRETCFPLQGLIPWAEAAHSQAMGTRLLQATVRLISFIRLTGAAPSVFIFPWVERELLESCSGEAGYWRPPSPQRLLEAQALCTRVGREWTFCLAFYSDRSSPCSCLGLGLRAAALFPHKLWDSQGSAPRPAPHSDRPRSILNILSREKG